MSGSHDEFTPDEGGNGEDGPAEHRFVLSLRTEDLAEWKCPRCNRHVRLDLRSRRLIIIEPGDQLVNHGGASIGRGVTLCGSVDARSSTDTIH
jgi:hypothetical protein